MASIAAIASIHASSEAKNTEASTAVNIQQALMQSLPQELHDMILELVFTAESEEVVITKDYKPPLLLQVDRASRKYFAETYYGTGSTFTFPHGLDEDWARSLAADHFDLITNIYCPLPKLEVDELTVADEEARERLEIQQVTVLLGILSDFDYARVRPRVTYWQVQSLYSFEFFSAYFGYMRWTWNLGGVIGNGVWLAKVRLEADTSLWF